MLKPREYMLRADPPSEGGRFSLFLYRDGNWEPRVQSEVTPQIAWWYHLVAGWDGRTIFLEVNGKTLRGRRPGQPATTSEQSQFGPFKGVMGDLRAENPNAKPSHIPYWPFDSALRDRPGHSHDGKGKHVRFWPGRLAQTLGFIAAPVQVAPGLRMHSWLGSRKGSTLDI